MDPLMRATEGFSVDSDYCRRELMADYLVLREGEKKDMKEISKDRYN
jgi:hypothetical protein